MSHLNENSIYRFYSNVEHDLQSLAENYLWFSKYAELNDPFEDIYIQNALSPLKVKRTKQESYDLYREMHKTILTPAQIEQDIINLETTNSFDERFFTIMELTYQHAQNMFDKFVKETRVCCLTHDNTVEKKPLSQSLNVVSLC